MVVQHAMVSGANGNPTETLTTNEHAELVLLRQNTANLFFCMYTSPISQCCFVVDSESEMFVVSAAFVSHVRKNWEF